MKIQFIHKMFHHRKLKVLMIITAASFLFAGCGKNPEFENYKANMNQFFENVKIYDQSINAIDPNSELAVADLLALLDSMDKSFAQMASLEVPEGFPGVNELADEASENITQAVSYYHQAFEGEAYNASLADVAKQYYDRANLRIQYILSIMHGNIPEEIYTTEDADVENGSDTPDTSEGGANITNTEQQVPEEDANPASDEDYSVNEYPDES